jgi:hypothetical protein
MTEDVARGALAALDLRDARRGSETRAAGTPRPGSSGSCSRILLPWDLDMIDVIGEALVGQV